MATAKRTLEQIILDNEWTSHSFFDSTELNALITGGIIDTSDDRGEAILSGLDRQNVQSTYRLGFSDIDHSEANIGSTISSQMVNGSRAFFKEANVKTFYNNQWWEVPAMERHLLNEAEPVRFLLEEIGRYWAQEIDMKIAATLDGMKDIPEITVGDGTKQFSEDLILMARELKGDFGVRELFTMYMSSATLFALLRKQRANTIDNLIVEAYGPTSLVGENRVGSDGTRGEASRGFSNVLASRTPRFFYNGVTPIVVSDNLEDGIAHMVDNGAFAYNQANFTDPIVYDYQPRAGNGAGIEQYGSRALFLLHPKGFSFTGQQSQTGGSGKFANNGGLTLAELKAGGQYELNEDVKLARIFNVRFTIA